MFAVLIFLLALVLANLSVTYFGPASMPINAFFFIGLDLSLRDYIHEKWHRGKIGSNMFGLVCAGAFITYLLNYDAGMICIASVISFAMALIADTITYQCLINRSVYIKMNGSNIVSSLIDSILFPTIAFWVLMPQTILLMFLAKVFGGALWVFIITNMPIFTHKKTRLKKTGEIF